MPDTGENKPTFSKPSKRPLILLAVIIVCFAVALTVGLVLHFKLNNDDSKEPKTMKRSSAVVDCYPELRRDKEMMMNNEDDCVARGCIWQPLEDAGAPWCAFPEDYGYDVVQDTPPQENDLEFTVQLRRKPAPEVIKTEMFDHVEVLVQKQTNNRLRVKIYPKNMTRWEVPADALDIEKTNDPSINDSTTLYNVTFTEKPFGIVVTRKSSGEVVFNTSLPGMILGDQYLQISTRLPSEFLYGFGEHRHESFKHDMNFRRWSMFTRDSGPNSDWNLYGHQPVYLNVENDMKANVVLLKNTNAMEVLLQPNPEPAITYVTIGGVLDFYIVLGDSPAEAVSHYIKAIGQPMFPPYWALGYHLSRWGYTGIDDMRAVIDRNRAAGIPYDAQWADIDTFHKAYVFTYDKEKWANFPQLVQDLKANKQHFITIVDPGIGSDDTIISELKADPTFAGYDMFHSGERAGVFVKAPNGTTLIAAVWPGVTAFPDFSNPATLAWWKSWIDYYINTLGIKVEALWIDMNEPASFVEGSVDGCERNRWNYPPFAPHIDGSLEDGAIYIKTICMDAQQYWGSHYNVHSLYAHTMASTTYKALKEVKPGERPWVMTRANYAGTGQYATKWQGDNRAEWSNMHYSIISLMEFGIFGFPMNGADICGFWLETTFELCVRWHQLGAFYPFARNHNGKGDDTIFMHQDPANFGPEFVDLVKPVLFTRYKFLPYFYTNLYRAHNDGEMIFKPLFFEFPEEKTMGIDKQFMLGPAFLLSPVLAPNATKVDAYFPHARWFDYTTGDEVSETGRYHSLATPLNKFNLHIRGGSIVPWQEPDVTTADSRDNDFGLLIALDESQKARGEMYWDDGLKDIVTSPPNYYLINFEMPKAGELVVTPVVKAMSGYANALKFNTLEIYGLQRMPSQLKVNGVVDPMVRMEVFQNVVRVTGLQKMINMPFTVSWITY